MDGVQQPQDSSWKSLDPPHVGVHSHCSRSSQKFVMEAEAPFEGEDYVVRELDVYLAGASSEDKKPAGILTRLVDGVPHVDGNSDLAGLILGDVSGCVLPKRTPLPPLPHRLFTYRSPRS